MNQQHLFPFQNLDAYRVARELARRVHESKIRDRELRDQATRAAKSCFLCLCEGLPNEGAAMRHKYFVESRNSLAETVGAMDLAATIGVARQEDVDTIQELGSRLRKTARCVMARSSQRQRDCPAATRIATDHPTDRHGDPATVTATVVQTVRPPPFANRVGTCADDPWRVRRSCPRPPGHRQRDRPAGRHSGRSDHRRCTVWHRRWPTSQSSCPLIRIWQSG